MMNLFCVLFLISDDQSDGDLDENDCQTNCYSYDELAPIFHLSLRLLSLFLFWWLLWKLEAGGGIRAITI